MRKHDAEMEPSVVSPPIRVVSLYQSNIIGTLCRLHRSDIALPAPRDALLHGHGHLLFPQRG